MGKQILTEKEMEIPEGVKVLFKARKFLVKGPRGNLTKDLSHLSFNVIRFKSKKTKRDMLRLQMWFQGRKQKCAATTIISHLTNMIQGVSKGYRARMRFAYNHFPIQANIINNGKTVEIRNFLGEKIIRRIDGLQDTVIFRDEDAKDEIELKGNDLEALTQTCALINQSCLVKKKDIRQFLDGIYVSETRQAVDQ